METETLMLNLSAQAAAALMILTAVRCGLPTTARAQAPARPDLERSASGQPWSDIKQRWLSVNGRKG